MNPLLKKVTGLNEDDIVPVPAGGLTRRTFQDRNRRRYREDEAEKDRSALKRVVGEQKEGVIPDNAEEIDGNGIGVLPKRLDPIVDVKRSPLQPSGEKEKLLTPYAALTAPDATPKALDPIDPSSVPGRGDTESFRASDLEEPEGAPAPAEAPVEQQGLDTGMDRATRAMDVLLGRSRSAAPARDHREFERAGAITSEAAAYSALNIKPPGMEETIGAAMVPGTPMPEHKTGDSKVICEAFRKFF